MAVISTSIPDAITHLINGEIIGLPTETVYGLAGNALNEDVVVEIFKKKNRPTFDPLIVHTNSLERIQKYVQEIPPSAQAIAEKFWPGPMTLILRKKSIIPDMVTSGLDTVAVRIPGHPMTLDLLEKLPFPLAAPSANPFGYISPTTAGHVNDQLGEQISFILDGGPTTVGIESTIIDFSGSRPTILRLGGLTLEAIQGELGDIPTQLSQGSNPSAPGMLDQHYAPRIPLLVGTIDDLVSKHKDKNLGIISLTTQWPNIDPKHQFMLSEGADLSEASKNLFAALRALDGLDIDLILAEWMPDEHLGRAINDRLKRASSE